MSPLVSIELFGNIKAFVIGLCRQFCIVKAFYVTEVTFLQGKHNGIVLSG